MASEICRDWVCRFGVTRCLTRPGQYAQQDSIRRNVLADQPTVTHQKSLADALPTSIGEDPGLAVIVGVWDRLPGDVRTAVMAMVKAALTPTNGSSH